MQAQDVALPGQEVVADVQPGHRVDVAADDTLGDDCRHVGHRVAPSLERVEGFGSEMQAVGVRFVPRGDLRVEVPAVVVESGLRGEGLHLVESQRLQCLERDDDVGHLHAGVVDVVLDLYLAPLEAEQPGQRIPEHRVAQVPDVRRLVGVDGGVFDDGLAGRRGRRRGRRWRPDALGQERRPVEEEIDVAARCRLDRGDAVDLAQALNQLLRD